MTFYHVAPKDLADKILSEGLRGDPEGWGNIVWAWDSRSAAIGYASDDDIIFEIDGTDFNPEPGTNPPSKYGGMAWSLDGPISPEKILVFSV